MTDSSEISPSLSGEMVIGTARNDVVCIIDTISNKDNFELDFSKIQKIDLSGIQVIISAKKTINRTINSNYRPKISPVIAEAMERCGYDHSADFETSEG